MKLKTSITATIIFLSVQCTFAPQAKAGDEKGKKTVCCDEKKKDCSKTPNPCSKPPCPKSQKVEKKETKSKARYIPVAPRSGNINAIPDLPAFELNSPLPMIVKNGTRYGDLTTYYAYADR